MHELSIAMSILDIVSEYAAKEKAREVTEIEIELGSLSGVVCDSLVFALEVATKNTISENAEIIVTEIKAKARCRHCEKTFEPENLFSACPYCKNSGYELLTGRELRVKSLKIEN
ncbi:MAG: hydrogenase maturation nickel metallochaperone HypA [Bacteroidales bacterium]